LEQVGPKRILLLVVTACLAGMVVGSAVTFAVMQRSLSIPTSGIVIGINVGVAAPMAYFPFSGWKDSFFGDLHAQGRDAIDFFTEKKVVVERWPSHWSRKF